MKHLLTKSPRQEICYDMPWLAYRKLRYMNCSTLKDGRRSMLHLRHAWQNGRSDTDVMRFGRGAHSILTRPREFERDFVEWTGGDKRRHPKEWAQFKAECAESGAEILDSEGRYSMDWLLRGVQAWLANPLICDCLHCAQSEVSLLTGEFDIQCKCRLDLVRQGELIDIKTTSDLGYRAFGRQFFQLGYGLQLGMYARWLQKVMGWQEYPKVTVICLENHPPFDSAVVPIDPAIIDQGEQLGMRLLLKLRQCIERDEWPGMAQGREYPLYVPPWEMDDEDDEITEGEAA